MKGNKHRTQSFETGNPPLCPQVHGLVAAVPGRMGLWVRGRGGGQAMRKLSLPNWQLSFLINFPKTCVIGRLTPWSAMLICESHSVHFPFRRSLGSRSLQSARRE